MNTSRKWESKADLTALIATVLVAWLWSTLAILLRPGYFFSDSFLLRDAGFSLAVVDHLLGGGKLYEGMFYQYGPLSPYFHAAVAYCFGNTAETYVRMLQAFCVLDVAMAYMLLRRVAQPLPACIFLIVGLLPGFLVPGSFSAVTVGPAYPSFERTVLLSLALCWKSPAEREVWRALGIGALLGSMQWIKFGGAFIAGFCLLVIDLAILYRQKADCCVWRIWAREATAIAVGFLLCEATLAWFLFVTCSGLILRDALWPSYMAQNYASYVGADRFPHWISWRYFVGTQVPTASSLVFFLFTIAFTFSRNGGRRGFDERAGPYLLLGLFFTVGMFAYFKHAWLIMDYAWILMLASGWIVTRLPTTLKVAIVALWAPCAAFNAKSLFAWESDRPKILTALPSTERLWLDPAVADRMRKLEAALKSLGAMPPGDGIATTLIMPIPPGIYHYFRLARATRHSWFMPGAVRNYDENLLVASVEHTSAVVLFLETSNLTSPSTDPATWDWSPFRCSPIGARFTAKLASVLQPPIVVDSHCFVFPVKHLAE